MQEAVKSLRHVACAAVALFIVTGANAQLQHQSLPNGFLTADGNSATTYPFNVTALQKWQWVYDSGQFAVQNPIAISEIAIRPSLPSTAYAGGAYNVEISMGTSINNYSIGTGYSTTFANNFVSTPVVVFSGTWTVAAGGPTANPAADWVPLTLQTPFNYNAANGKDLIVQIRTLGSPANAIRLRARHQGDACRDQRRQHDRKHDEQQRGRVQLQLHGERDAHPHRIHAAAGVVAGQPGERCR